MDTNKMREQAGQQFEAFYAEYEKKREANGWMPLETHVVVHMRSAWAASRASVVVELPGKPCYRGYAAYDDAMADAAKAIEAHGLKVAP